MSCVAGATILLKREDRRKCATNLQSSTPFVLAELIRAREIEPIEVIDATIARIERLNPQLNAVIHRLFDKARAQALSGTLPDGTFAVCPCC